MCACVRVCVCVYMHACYVSRIMLIFQSLSSDKSVKELRERLLKAKGTPNLSKVEDINVVCGCLKDFLHSIREPVVTFRMHPAFMQAVG